MAKKKIKTKASLLVAAAVASVKDATKDDDDSRRESHRKVGDNEDSSMLTNDTSTKVQILTARLKTAVGKSSSLHKQARVIMMSTDAIQLNLSVGDKVILLSLDDDHEERKPHCLVKSDNTIASRRIKALTVLPIEIHHDTLSTNHRIASPMVGRKNNFQQQWSSGTIQIASASVLENFLSSPSSIDQTQRKDLLTGTLPCTPTVSTPISQPPSTTTTTTTTPFSFKNMVASPTSSHTVRTPSSSSTKAKLQTEANRKGPSVKVIPCRTALGQVLLQSCTVASAQITIEPTELLSSWHDGIPTAARPTLERLVRAHLLDSHVTVGQRFNISFTGKPFPFRMINATTNAPAPQPDPRVSSLTSEGTNDDPLDGAFAKLQLHNIEDTKDWNDEEKELYTLLSNSNIQLYHVGQSTRIVIGSNQEPTNEVDPIETDRNTNMKMSRLQKPNQYVAGLSATLEELRSLLLPPLRRPELFTSRGMKVPRGVLLHGPNGVGKTALSKQFRLEVEQAFHCRTQYVHCASLQSKSDIVGEAESVLSRLFRPTMNVPTLLVLDDIHLICAKRGSGGSSQGMDRLAATLLALMDGIEGNNQSRAESSRSPSSTSGNVVILAITTNPSLLDPALRRPGRLDAEIEVPLPEDASSRAEIIKFHVTNFGIELGKDLQQQSDFVDVAKAAKGFNGADCMLAVKEAIRLAILAASDSGVVLEKHHLLTAMRTIKPSAIKSITVDIPQVLWSSIGGMDSVKRDLREAIELPLSHNEYFEQLRVPPPRGILLYGPPGCSKTLMARALATEGNMNFLAVKGPELLSKWLGESERALSSLFRRARMASPAIVFFDEIDAIASKRGGGDSASSSRLLSQLLTELDGVNHTGSVGGGGTKPTKHPRVVVVGATNRPDLLDTALTRPGRIDRMIYVGPPDAASRAQILRLTLQKSFCSTDIDISILADDQMTGGFSGAEMVAICRDAALLALEEGDENDEDRTNMTTTGQGRLPMIEMRHLTASIQSMPRQITPSMIEFYKTYQEKVTAI